MRRALVLGVPAAIVLGLLWLFAARPLVLLADRVHTVPVGALSSNPIGWNGSDLFVGGHILDLQGPGPDYRAPISLTVDSQGRLVATLAIGGRLVLGPRAGILPRSDGPIPAYAGESGDAAAMVIEQSWLNWPTFFDFHVGYLDGPSATWRRNVYYRLSWKKRSGEQLDLLWRFEQGYDSINGWTAADGTRDGVTGLISAGIEPARAE